MLFRFYKLKKNKKIPSVEIIPNELFLEFMVNFMMAYNEYMADFIWILQHVLGMEWGKEVYH